jgi:hypothetical protein
MTQMGHGETLDSGTEPALSAKMSIIPRLRNSGLRAALLALFAFVTALPAQTLVGYYNFNQASSPIADQAASPADMAGIGGPNYNQPSIPGLAFGATASLSAGAYWTSTLGSKYTSLLNDFTVMAWINPSNINGIGNHSTVIFGSSTPGGWAVGFNGAEQGATVGQPYFVNYGIAAYDLGSGSSASLLANNTWVNLAITKSSATGVSIFINGSLVGNISGAIEAANSHGANDWYIGNGGDLARQFAGSIDELRIYDSVLNQAQIQSISAIPEPSTYAACCGAAILAFAGWRRQRRRLEAWGTC